MTLEHEYILILRKGSRREFKTQEEKARRRESAFFWEERNVWCSDIWMDIRGTSQKLEDASRKRSATFPFELPYRLIALYSIKGDIILDPFAGTGTTLGAPMALGRNSIGVELDESLLPVAQKFLRTVPEIANEYNRSRLARHLEGVEGYEGGEEIFEVCDPPLRFSP